MNVYDAITFVLRQSIRAPETVVKIRDSSDGSVLFFAHSSSVTMWDVQTGGLVHTFTTESKIDDMVLSALGDHIACGLSGGAVAFWNIHSKEEGKSFIVKVGQPVVAIYWLSYHVLVVATEDSIYTRDITVGKTTDSLPIPGRIWGMVYSEDKAQFWVGVYQRGSEKKRRGCFFVTIKYAQTNRPGLRRRKLLSVLEESPVIDVELSSPVLVGGDIACITPGGGVLPFNTVSFSWTNKPPLLGAARSVAVSLNRNLVVQTEDSIQIFSVSVLTSSVAYDDVRSSHIYPLDETYIVCVRRPNKLLILLELETLREAHLNDNTSSLRSSFTETWRLGALLPEWKMVDEGVPLGGLSPKFIWAVLVSGSPRRRLRVRCATDGTTVVDKTLLDGELAGGEVYGVAFDSETRFYLKINRPGGRVKIPYDIIAESPSVHLTRGKPVPLPAPRATPPYTLDENCEWVLDAESRRVCWISPGDIRRGDGGHFWAGDRSLVMVGGDGVVRKLTFKDPDR